MVGLGSERSRHVLRLHVRRIVYSQTESRATELDFEGIGADDPPLFPGILT